MACEADAALMACRTVVAAHVRNPDVVTQAVLDWVYARAFEEFRKDAAERATAQIRHERYPVAGAGIQPR